MAWAAASPALAIELRQFAVAGKNGDLRDALFSASLVAAAEQDATTTARGVIAAAQADYARLLRVLYANGYYSGVVHIYLDGREAAGIPTFSPPAHIDAVAITIDPGPVFRFGRAEIAPLAPGSQPPAEFRPGAPAHSTVLQQTVDAAVVDWRANGHAKVAISGQQVTANHAARTLSARLRLTPGPRVRFGDLRQTSTSAVRAARVRRIAGLPKGQVFSPAEMAKVANRLRRTGAFSSVSLSEAKTLGPGNTMDIDLALVDEKPRRFGFGAEISSFEGLTFSGFWLHRNLFGGAERFRVEGEVSGIGGQTGGIDYSLGTRLEIPAAFGTDTKAFVFTNASFEDEPSYRAWQSGIGGGAVWIMSDKLEAELGVALRYSETRDSFGDRRFVLLTLPAAATWDNRDNVLNPTRGTYLKAQATPFISLEGTGGGLRFYADGRAYRSLSESNGFVLAGRVQAGATVGASLASIPPDFLFYSGGGGTVRGQPYQSLGVDLGGGNITGGRSFLAMSAELRAKASDKIGLVGFVDAGYVGSNGFLDNSGAWHAGAGLGLRYDTGIGPIRLDIAAPISGTTGKGTQIYVGIGQAF
jgi:translocation and assembly module TamA